MKNKIIVKSKKVSKKMKLDKILRAPKESKHFLSEKKLKAVEKIIGSKKFLLTAEIPKSGKAYAFSTRCLNVLEMLGIADSIIKRTIHNIL